MQRSRWRQREAVADLVVQPSARAAGEGVHQRRRRPRRRAAATAAGGGELQRVHELVEPVRDPAAAEPQGAAARGVHVAAAVPDHRAGAGGGGHVVAVVAGGGGRPDGAPLLRLHLLGCVRLLQRRVRVPAGAARAGAGARVGDVRALVLLHVAHGGRPPHGARAPRRVHRHRLPHGRAQPVAGRVRAHARRDPLLRARRRGARPRRRRRHDGRQARLHARHRRHARLPPHRRLLRPQRAGVHGVGQVHLLHLLLLPAAHRRAVQRPPRPPPPAGGGPRRGQPGRLRRRARRHVLRLPAARLPRAPPGQEVIEHLGSIAARGN